MKKGLAILCLVMFSLRPAYYVGQLAYFELNIDTIIQKYCVNKDKPQMQCNGKCHLAKQLKLTDSSDENPPINIVLQAFFPVFLMPLEPIDFQSVAVTIPNKPSFHYNNLYTLERRGYLYRPPIS